jgi:hypothetical protein
MNQFMLPSPLPLGVTTYNLYCKPKTTRHSGAT